MSKQFKITLITVFALLGVFLLSFKILSHNETKDIPKNNDVKENKTQITHSTSKGKTLEDDTEIEVLDDEDGSKKEPEKKEVFGPTEPDFEKEIKGKFGVEQVRQAKEAAGIALSYWILDKNVQAEWEQVATEDFYEKKVKTESFKEDVLTRKLESLEISPTQPANENEMRFSIFAQWKVLNGTNVINNQKKFYYVSLVESNGKWLVSEIEDF